MPMEEEMRPRKNYLRRDRKRASGSSHELGDRSQELWALGFSKDTLGECRIWNVARWCRHRKELAIQTIPRGSSCQWKCQTAACDSRNMTCTEWNKAIVGECLNKKNGEKEVLLKYVSYGSRVGKQLKVYNLHLSFKINWNFFRRVYPRQSTLNKYFPRVPIKLFELIRKLECEKLPTPLVLLKKTSPVRWKILPIYISLLTRYLRMSKDSYAIVIVTPLS